MSASPQTVGLLLLPGFALMSYASVVEPLRAANLLAGKELYRWVHVSPGAATVTASCGAQVPCTAKPGDSLKLDLLFVCAGGNPTAFRDKTTLQWLRTLAGRGVRIGGVSGTATSRRKPRTANVSYSAVTFSPASAARRNRMVSRTRAYGFPNGTAFQFDTIVGDDAPMPSAKRPGAAWHIDATAPARVAAPRV